MEGVRVRCCGIDFSDGNSLMRGRGVSGCGDSGGVRNSPSSSSSDLCSGFSGSSKVLRGWYSFSAFWRCVKSRCTFLGSKRFLLRLYSIPEISPICMLR